MLSCKINRLYKIFDLLLVLLKMYFLHFRSFIFKWNIVVLIPVSFIVNYKRRFGSHAIQSLFLVPLCGWGCSAETVLFMKGTPDAPRCGFSRKIVAILREEKIEFESFDILEDQDVRQCMKELYDWPTFPQVMYSESLRMDKNVDLLVVSHDCPLEIGRNVTLIR